MKTQGDSLSSSRSVGKVAEQLFKLSALLFALAIPTSIALDNFAAAVAIVALILSLIFRVSLPLPPLKPLLFLLLTEVWHYLPDLKRTIKSTDLKQYLAAYFVGYKTGLERDFLKKVSLLLGVSTVISVLAQGFEAVFWQNVKHLNLHHLQLHHSLMRAKGLLNHPLTTGGVEFVLFFLHLALYQYFKEKRYLLFSLFALAGVVLSQSRSYWLGVFAFALFGTLLLLPLKEFRRKAVLFLASLFLFTGAVLSFPTFKHRLESVTNLKSNGSNMDRLTIWRAYYYSFKSDYSPLDFLLGVGSEGEALALKHGKEACLAVYPKNYCENGRYLARMHHGLTHNVYLKYFSKYGLLGLFAFLLFWFYALYLNFKALLERRELLFAVFLAGYLGFLTAGLFENNFTDAEVQTAVLFTLGLNFALLKVSTSQKPLRR
jgi:O-antigen ligase